MKDNYKIVFSFKTEYDYETSLKIASIAVALNGSLYSIDYHGDHHGIKITSEEDTYMLTVLVNECIVTPDDIIEEFKKILNRYKTSKYFALITHSDSVYDIPEDEYTDQYYFNWYPIEEK